MAGFVALVGVLAYWQVYAREPLATDPANSLQSRKIQEVPRGTILAGDGETELARSEQEEDGDTYTRIYPEGPLYAGVLGYWSTKYGASGIEIGQNNNLSGNGEPETLDELINQVSGPQAGNNVELTLDPEVQRVSYEGLAASNSGRGAIVAINPKNGEILSLVSYPSYDPNEIDENFPDLAEDPDSPLVNRATQGLYPPGSTFKVITAAAALEAGLDPSEEFRDTGTYETPGYTVYNYKAKKYGNVTFAEALANSINAVFARIAYEYVGGPALGQTAEEFGFGDTYEDFPLPVRPSSLGDLPPDQWAQGLIAQIAFGQGPAVSNPFEMALIAAAIANDGTMMEPRLVREVRSPDGAIVDKPTPSVRNQAIPQETARAVNDMMQLSVTDVELDAQIPGIKVAGKTGTAETGSGELHSWFISFAPADDPEIAVAVIVENGQEGFKSALPLARRIMESYLRSQGELPNEPPNPQAAATQPPVTQPAQPQPSVQPAQPKTGSTAPNPFQAPGQVPGQGPGQAPKSQNTGQRPGG